MGDFYAGGVAVYEEAAGFLFEDLDELAMGEEVGFVAEKGGGEVAVQRAGGTEGSLPCVAGD